MPRANDGKEAKKKGGSPYEVVQQWSSKPLSVKKGAANKCLYNVLPVTTAPSLPPTIGTFSTNIFENNTNQGLGTPYLRYTCRITTRPFHRPKRLQELRRYLVRKRLGL